MASSKQGSLCIRIALLFNFATIACGGHDAASPGVANTELQAESRRDSEQPSAGSRESSDPLVPKFSTQSKNQNANQNGQQKTPQKNVDPEESNTIKVLIVPTQNVMTTLHNVWGNQWRTEADTAPLELQKPGYLEWNSSQPFAERSAAFFEAGKKFNSDLSVFWGNKASNNSKSSPILSGELSKLSALAIEKATPIAHVEFEFQKEDLKKQLKSKDLPTQLDQMHKLFPAAEMGMRIALNSDSVAAKQLAESKLFDSFSLSTSGSQILESTLSGQLSNAIGQFEPLPFAFLSWELPTSEKISSPLVQAQIVAFFIHTITQKISPKGFVQTGDLKVNPATAFLAQELRGDIEVLEAQQEELPQLSAAKPNDLTFTAALLRNSVGKNVLIYSNPSNSPVEIEVGMQDSGKPSLQGLKWTLPPGTFGKIELLEK